MELRPATKPDGSGDGESAKGLNLPQQITIANLAMLFLCIVGITFHLPAPNLAGFAIIWLSLLATTLIWLRWLRGRS